MKIKDMREELKWSMREVTDFLEIPYRTWQHWEGGTRTLAPWMEKLIIFRLQHEMKMRRINSMYTIQFKINGEDWQVVSTSKTLEDANKEMEHQIKTATDTENDKGDRLAIWFDGKIIEEWKFDGNAYEEV